MEQGGGGTRSNWWWRNFVPGGKGAEGRGVGDDGTNQETEDRTLRGSWRQGELDGRQQEGERLPARPEEHLSPVSEALTRLPFSTVARHRPP